jgi:NAD(P)-dependent dehydrogenase (short-subunit alcohol dehydrogenase family)
MSTVSLVTGGNRGIGREVCRRLAELGHVVLLTARSADASAAAARAVHAESLSLDVKTPAGSPSLGRNHDHEQFWAHSTANCSRS